MGDDEEMKHKTARLQRWLDRLTAACENKKWKSAVAEADCLSAELRQMRDELWQQAEQSSVPQAAARIRGYASFGVRSFGIALVIICLCSFPIAVESGRPENIAALPTNVKGDFEEIAFVTAEEKELLQLLRKNLNDGNIAVRAAEVKKDTSPPAEKKLTARVAERRIADIPQRTEGRPSARQKPQNERLQAEELLTLIQIGEKSLRGDTQSIRIIN